MSFKHDSIFVKTFTHVCEVNKRFLSVKYNKNLYTDSI